MKIVIRTLIILAAALLVVGATMAFASSGAMGNFGLGNDGFERRPPVVAAEGNSPSGFLPGAEGGRLEGFGRHEGGRGGFASGELLKNLAIIAVIIAVVSLITRLTDGLRPQRR